MAAFDKSHSRVRHFGGVFTFPYKNTWASRYIVCILSSPRTPGPALNSRAGLVRFTPAQADYELGHGGNERVRLPRTLNPRPSYPHEHHAHTITMRALSSTSLTVFLGSLGAQVAFDKCQFRARHFGGVFISPYKPTPQLCTRSRMLSWLPYVSKLSRGHEACNVMIICVAIGLNHVIS